MEAEYNVLTKLEGLPHQLARIVEGPEEQIELLPWRYGLIRAQDAQERLIGLFRSDHELRYYQDKYPELLFKVIE